jgi:beta-glucosidase
MLKEEAAFDGFVVSDWGATHSTVNASLAGLDQEMPTNFYFDSALAAAVAAGTVPQARLDDMSLRVLTPMYAMGLFDAPNPGWQRNVTVRPSTPGHAVLARTLAEGATVLLKNDGGVLPLAPAGLTSLLVVGDNATVTGSGSGGVAAPYIVSPYDGITAALAAQGYSNVAVSYVSGDDPAAAAAAAAAADVAVVVVATSSSEGVDRPDLSLPAAQLAAVAAIAAAQPRTVVVARCPGACLMPFKDAVPAILFQGMPGQEAGSALASVLLGAATPSGKLPSTFPASEADTWLGAVPNEQWPGTDRGRGYREADYSEGLLMGYRWVDATGAAPLWPFGHGLSYANFSYGGLAVAGAVSPTANATATVVVTNTAAAHAGAEVVQLYASHPAAAGEPPKVLVDFVKTPPLPPGGSATVTLTVTPAALRVWNVTAQAWALVPGAYTLAAASSSRDVRATALLTVTA